MVGVVRNMKIAPVDFFRNSKVKAQRAEVPGDDQPGSAHEIHAEAYVPTGPVAGKRRRGPGDSEQSRWPI